MTLYRIFTEDKNRNNIHALVAKQFDGFTAYAAQGFWQGQAEPSYVVEILAEGTAVSQAKVVAVAAAIRQHNAQESVLVVSNAVNGLFV